MCSGVQGSSWPSARVMDLKRVEDFSMPATIEKEPDQKRLVALLAADCHIPIGEMATLYEHERAALALGAHITKYLHIFATRNVLEILERRDLDQRVPASGQPPGLAS